MERWYRKSAVKIINVSRSSFKHFLSRFTRPGRKKVVTRQITVGSRQRLAVRTKNARYRQIQVFVIWPPLSIVSNNFSPNLPWSTTWNTGRLFKVQSWNIIKFPHHTKAHFCGKTSSIPVYRNDLETSLTIPRATLSAGIRLFCRYQWMMILNLLVSVVCNASVKPRCINKQF